MHEFNYFKIFIKFNIQMFNELSIETMSVGFAI